MTLFTGNKNAAKYIYLSAGFEIRSKFAWCMKEKIGEIRFRFHLFYYLFSKYVS